MNTISVTIPFFQQERRYNNASPQRQPAIFYTTPIRLNV